MGYKVRKWRNARALSQAALATRAGVRRPTVSDIERGVVEPQPSTIRALARALRVSLEELRRGPLKN